MKKDSFLVRLLINALAFLIVSKVYSGMSVRGFWAAVIAALIWGLVNALLRPVLLLLTLPFNILTLGLFTIVINTGMLLLTSRIGQTFGFGLTVDGFWQAVLGSLVISLVSVVMSMIFRDELKGKK